MRLLINTLNIFHTFSNNFHGFFSSFSWIKRLFSLASIQLRVGGPLGSPLLTISDVSPWIGSDRLGLVLVLGFGPGPKPMCGQQSQRVTAHTAGLRFGPDLTPHPSEWLQEWLWPAPKSHCVAAVASSTSSFRRFIFFFARQDKGREGQEGGNSLG